MNPVGKKPNKNKWRIGDRSRKGINTEWAMISCVYNQFYLNNQFRNLISFSYVFCIF